MNQKPENVPESYLNREFMTSGEARPIRILSEYLHPNKIFKEHNIENTIVFFGSARIKSPLELFHYAKSLDLTSNEKHQKKFFIAKKISRFYKDAVRLAFLLTRWSKENNSHFFMASGGGPGIMEAANRGAWYAKGKTVGLNIELPFEQHANRYITKELSFDFHYFFMRKYWFIYLAKALLIFPGGFGTLDELTELLTLVQTKKVIKPVPIVMFGASFWKEIINFDKLIECEVISEEDLNYLFFSDSVEETYEYLTNYLNRFYID